MVEGLQKQIDDGERQLEEVRMQLLAAKSETLERDSHVEQMM